MSETDSGPGDTRRHLTSSDRIRNVWPSSLLLAVHMMGMKNEHIT